MAFMASGGPNREELLQLAIRAAKEGNADSAKMMFEQILAQDKKNERAMMWMAKLSEKKSERKQWLDRVLAINPDNETARQALQKMAYSRSANENRTLLIFGMIAGVLIVLALVLVAALIFIPR
jgi:cytochrome c-type biogenesis protein CcmH/NrfG